MKRNDRRTLVACFALAVIIVASGCGRGEHEVGAAALAEAGDGQQRRKRSTRATRNAGNCLPGFSRGTRVGEVRARRADVSVRRVPLRSRRRETGRQSPEAGRRRRTGANADRGANQGVCGPADHRRSGAERECGGAYQSPHRRHHRVRVRADIGARVKAGDTLLTLASVELGRALAEYERNRTLSELSEKIFTRETKTQGAEGGLRAGYDRRADDL